MKTSLVIPCIPQHFKNLNRTLDSFLNGTILPDETIIVLSGTKKINHKSIEEFKLEWGKKLKNFYILEFPNIQSCGKNRNIGNSKAQNEIIIHADADDIFHPQRIEILLYFFNNTDAVVINHLYIPESKEFKKYDIPKIKLAGDSKRIYNHYFPQNKWRELASNEYYGSFLNMTTTDGHMAFRREVLKKESIPDINSSCEGRFLHKICFHYKKNIFLHACLSKYSKGDYWINRFPKENGDRLNKSLEGEKEYVI